MNSTLSRMMCLLPLRVLTLRRNEVINGLIVSVINLVEFFKKYN